MERLNNCRICPRACGADRTAGIRGRCGADATIWVARAALHQWEEPPVSGERGSGAVFFTHCALGCVFCQNRQISRREDIGKPVTITRLAEIFLELECQRAHNINLVTGSHYAPQIEAALRLARAQGLSLPVLWNSSGYETVSTLQRLDGLIDIYLPDYKYYSSYYAGRYSHAADYPETARDAIAEMVRQVGAPVYGRDGMLKKGVIIRHLMLPGLGGDTAQVLRSIAEHWGDRVLVSLMRQYTPFGMKAYPEIDRKITDGEYAEAVEWMQSLGLTGFIQERESIRESFIPAFTGEGVSAAPTKASALCIKPPQKGDLSIRPLLPSDSRRAVSDLYEQSWKAAYREIIPHSWFAGIPSGSWAAVLDTPGIYTLLLLEHNRVIGTTSYCRSRDPETPEYGELVSIYLLPAYTRQGYGKLLLSAAAEGLLSLGFHHIFLWVLADNRPARAFYEKKGFFPSGRSRMAVFGDTRLREVQYCLDIDRPFPVFHQF